MFQRTAARMQIQRQAAHTHAQPAAAVAAVIVIHARPPVRDCAQTHAEEQIRSIVRIVSALQIRTSLYI